MLQHLFITNYAIIDQLEIEFKNNFTVITGETGAGKSILLGALSLILGERANTGILNNKDKKCIVEGAFLIPEENNANFFNINDLDFESPCVLRREINPKGKSRAFINDTPVGLNLLKELASKLIDVHSQHETLRINESKFQIDVVDAFAKTGKDINEYKKKFQLYTKKKAEINELVNQSQSSKTDLDYIQFQVNEIELLNLKPNEQSDIEAQLEIINNAEEIKKVIVESSELLSDSTDNILSGLNSVTNLFENISQCSDEYKILFERLSSLNIELKDIADEVALLNSDESFNVNDADYLNNRLNSIYSLNQKHRVNHSNDLISLNKQLVEKLNLIDFSDEKIEALRYELSDFEKGLFQIASTISNQRLNSLSQLTKAVTSNLFELGMPDASFKINHKQLGHLTELGIDEIEFVFSGNKGVIEKPLNKVASGGELSRLMLTIKSILSSNSNISTIVFDEIDTGVSGDIADKMGSIMGGMSSEIQVIAITHLPQVAAKGKHHYKIFKKNVEGKTLTSISNLNKNERVEEIAKMLSGKKTSTAALENANVLLEN
jgi:DNA repair protein RecN (Recombination protein N)